MTKETEFNYTSGLPVVSPARKLVFEVPKASQKPIFPLGATLSPYGQNNDEPDLIVFNATDKGGTWQGADGENGVVIINEVSNRVAEMALKLYATSNTNSALQALLDLLSAEGQNDQYTSDKKFVDDKLVPTGRRNGPYTGIFKRNATYICYLFRDNHGVIWRYMGEDNVKHIEEDILLRTYVLNDGTAINPEDIPAVEG